MQAEYGSVGNIRFLSPENVTMYDENGNKVEIPKCAKCGSYKTLLLGTYSHAYFCNNGCDQPNG